MRLQEVRELGDQLIATRSNYIHWEKAEQAWKEYWKKYDAEREQLLRKVPCAGCGKMLDPTSREDQMYSRKSVLDDGTAGLFCSNGCAIHGKGRIDINEDEEEAEEEAKVT